jgi:hypothetical protein
MAIARPRAGLLLFSTNWTKIQKMETGEVQGVSCLIFEATRFRVGFVLAIVATICSLAAGVRAETPKVTAAVFDFELYDTSLEGEVRGLNEAEQQRLGMISELLRRLMVESGRYRVVDLTPVAAEIEAAGLFRGCNGCDVDIARELGAALSVTGVVQKVSNLILNINIYIRDTANGGLVKVMSADIRGNTDQTWSRGVSWLVRNNLLAD